jgi:hypothetical protein
MVYNQIEPVTIRQVKQSQFQDKFDITLDAIP